MYVEWGGRKERREGLEKRERKIRHEEGGREKERNGEKKNFAVFMYHQLSDS